MRICIMSMKLSFSLFFLQLLLIQSVNAAQPVCKFNSDILSKGSMVNESSCKSLCAQKKQEGKCKYLPSDDGSGSEAGVKKFDFIKWTCNFNGDTVLGQEVYSDVLDANSDFAKKCKKEVRNAVENKSNNKYENTAEINTNKLGTFYKAKVEYKSLNGRMITKFIVDEDSSKLNLCNDAAYAGFMNVKITQAGTTTEICHQEKRTKADYKCQLTNGENKVLAQNLSTDSSEKCTEFCKEQFEKYKTSIFNKDTVASKCPPQKETYNCKRSDGSGNSSNDAIQVVHSCYQF